MCTSRIFEFLGSIRHDPASKQAFQFQQFSLKKRLLSPHSLISFVINPYPTLYTDVPATGVSRVEALQISLTISGSVSRMVVDIFGGSLNFPLSYQGITKSQYKCPIYIFIYVISVKPPICYYSVLHLQHPDQLALGVPLHNPYQ